MMNMMTDEKIAIVQLTRDCVARMVPQGAQIVLREGTEVKIVQDLGNSFSVDVYGNLARIEGHDADALGREVYDLLDDLPKDATIDEKIQIMLGTVYDPEIPVSILALGLVYKVEAKPIEGKDGFYLVQMQMTLTAAGCGMGPVIVADAKEKLMMIPEVDDVDIELVFDPPWDRSMISDEAKLALGMF
jgi:probable FeS assembly SUF system protein SufT